MTKTVRMPSGKSSRRAWYSARVVMQAAHPQERVRKKLLEESIILVRAASNEEARRKAEKLGRAREHSYLNMYGKRVKWVFLQLLDVVEILENPSKEGAEVYYRFLNKTELKLVLRRLRARKRKS